MKLSNYYYIFLQRQLFVLFNFFINILIIIVLVLNLKTLMADAQTKIEHIIQQ